MDPSPGASFGARVFPPELPAVVEASASDLYFYRAFIGRHAVQVERGDCAFLLSADEKTAELRRGPATVDSRRFAVVVRGYMPDDRSCALVTGTHLPYINGCSSRQVFPPERPGDPTLQLLTVPPFCSEQAHHVHPTTRVVYVLRGRGRCVVGMPRRSVSEELTAGTVVILEKMCPHHFETDDEGLTVLPVHVFSSVPGTETSHPMYAGTHRT